MATFEITRSFGAVVDNTKIKFSKLYMRQIYEGPNMNQSTLDKNVVFGQLVVINYGIYDDVGIEAKLVAKAQGWSSYAGNFYSWFSITFFEGERFKSSTLQVMGVSALTDIDVFAIVGGTGDFAMARGILTKKVHQRGVDTNIFELTVDGFCHMNIQVPAPTKMGPWGAKDAPLREMEGKSQRLESVTVYFNSVVSAIQFSYIGEDGQICNSGLWGSCESTNSPSTAETIKFCPTEFVKEITGTVGDPDYLSQLKIVTNVKTYGPFGPQDGKSPFNFTVPEDKTVVGFFAQCDDYIRKIGVYTI
ncbi:hypothetical protein ACQ4PT_012680 [Festuca glaucescens]